jgi:fumarate hydratase subunit beta
MTEYKLTTPIKEEDIRKLNIGDIVHVTGTIYAARDEAHQRLMEYAERGEKPPVNLDGAAIYHVGPVVRKKNGAWEVVAAGPTTSTRMNKITPQVLEKYPIRMIIGKGGMSREVSEAMKKHGVVYCHYTGGAAVLAAKNIRRVLGVEWLDLGIPEALWIFEAENFGPLVITIDAKGNSMYEKLSQEQKKNLENLISQL